MSNLVNGNANFPGFSNVAGSVPSPAGTCVITTTAHGHAVTTGEGACLMLAIYAYADYLATPPLTPIALQSVTDSAGNTWTFSTSSSSQNPPAQGISDTVNPDYNNYTLSAIAYCLGAKPVSAVTVTLTNATAYYIGADLYEADGVPWNAAVTAAASAGAAGGGEQTTYTTPSITVNAGDLVIAVSTPKNGWNSCNAPFTINPQTSGKPSNSAYIQDAAAGAVSCTFTGAYNNAGTGWASTNTQWIDSSCILAIGGTAGSTLNPASAVRLFSAEKAPANRENDNTPVNATLGMDVTPSKPVQMTAFWFFSPTGINSAEVLPQELALYDALSQSVIPGTHVTSPSWDGAGSNGGGTWYRQPLASPVTLQAYRKYIPSGVLSGSAQGYIYDTTYTFPFNDPSGLLTSDAARSVSGASLAYPSASSTSSAYLIDAELSLAGSGLTGLYVVRAVAQTATVSGQVAFTLQSAPAPGNLLVAFCAYSQHSSARTINTPSGWTKVDDQTGGAGSSDSLASFWRAVQPADGTSWTFTLNETSQDYTSGILYEITGADTSVPVNQHAWQDSGSGNSLATGPVTPSVPGCLPLAAWSLDGSTGLAYSGITAGWLPDDTDMAPYHSTSAGHGPLTADTSTAISATYTFTGTGNAGSVSDILLITPAPAPGVLVPFPPGRQSPMAWQYLARPSRAPLLVTAGDTGSGAGASSITATLSDTDTGTEAEGGLIAMLPRGGLLGGSAANANTYGGSVQ